MIFEKDLQGATALVTGGNRGIGRAIVLLLLSRGLRVLAVGRDEEALGQLETEAGEWAGSLETARCDLAVPESIDALYGKAHVHFSRLDLLVNNAGVGYYGPCDELTVEEWDRMMDINARGAFICSQRAFAWMKQSGGGRIINIASVVAHKGYERQIGYAASKHAMLGITKVMAREGQPFNIRCSAICPGGVATEMVRQARPDLDPEGLIQPLDVARAVWYLASEPDTVVTDQIDLRRATGTPFA